MCGSKIFQKIVAIIRYQITKQGGTIKIKILLRSKNNLRQIGASGSYIGENASTRYGVGKKKQTKTSNKSPFKSLSTNSNVMKETNPVETVSVEVPSKS